MQHLYTGSILNLLVVANSIKTHTRIPIVQSYNVQTTQNNI